MNDLFNVQIFFVVFREALEAVIVVSVLLAFVNQSLGSKSPEIRKRLVRQIWFGTFAGIFICIAIGAGFIAAYYTLQNDYWARTEDLYEGIMCIIATILISLMGIAMLRVNKMQAKWRVKIAKAIAVVPSKKKDRLKCGYIMKKYSMFILPFITTLREGLEAVVFVGGVGVQSSSAKSFPIPVICGLAAGALVGGVLYYFGSTVSLQIFLCISTSMLYLISAGLFSRGVWFFENYMFNRKTGGDAAESGSGPGSYDISKTVWHVNCCNPLIDSGWDVFNSLLGWQNTATYGSVLAYNIYWIFLMAVLLLMLFEEKKGHLPFFKSLTLRKLNPMYHLKNKKKEELTLIEQEILFRKAEEQFKLQVEKEERLSGESLRYAT
ncbi:high-affinity iron permease [Martiniozyma asiatica (nom. inval.)]|nr:high-affinity iron permease [Martiniozyma asiatica]